METITLESFSGHSISFKGDAWVNATQMAKPFGKACADFLRLASTDAFIKCLAADLAKDGNPHVSCVDVARGAGGGTWMHPDLALEFARWLSPEFAIWCNRVIRRILSGQSAEVPVAALANAIDRMTATLQGFDARLSALEAERAPVASAPTEPRPDQARIYDRLVSLMGMGASLDVGTVAYALGVNLQDFYSWLRLKGWVRPGATSPNPKAVEMGVVRELNDGSRHVRTLITANGIQRLAMDFRAPHCLGPFLAAA